MAAPSFQRLFKKYFGIHAEGVLNWMIIMLSGLLGMFLLTLFSSLLTFPVLLGLSIGFGILMVIGALGFVVSLWGTSFVTSLSNTLTDDIARQTITLTPSDLPQPTLFPNPLALEIGDNSDKNRIITMERGLVYRFGTKETETGGRQGVDITKGSGNSYVLHGPNPDYDKPQKTLKQEDLLIEDDNGNKVHNWKSIIGALPPVQFIPLHSQVNAIVHCPCTHSKYILIARDTFSDEHFIVNASNTQDNNVCVQIFERFGRHVPNRADMRPKQLNKFDIIFIPIEKTLEFDDLEIPSENVASWKTLDSKKKSKISEIYFDIENKKFDIRFEDGKESHEQLSSDNTQKLK